MNYPTIKTEIINNETVNAVNGRDLWSFLESKQDFSTWMKKRLEDFELGYDYDLLHNSVEQDLHGGHNKSEYILTLDTAKSISMMEKNAKGKEVRRYFLDCEAKLKQTAKAMTMSEIVAYTAQQLVEIERQQIQQQQQIESNRRINDAIQLKCEKLQQKIDKPNGLRKLSDVARDFDSQYSPKSKKLKAGTINIKKILIHNGILFIRGNELNAKAKYGNLFKANTTYNTFTEQNDRTLMVTETGYIWLLDNLRVLIKKWHDRL